MIKELIKKYKVFILLVIINIIAGLAFPVIGLKSIELTKQNIIEMISVIPPIFVLLGLLDVWVDRTTMIKFTGKGSGAKGVLIALLLGSAAAGPLYAAFPIAGIMLRKGSSMFNVFVFIGAWSTTKIPMLTFEAASLGIKFTLTRLALSLIGIFIIAMIVKSSLNEENQKEILAINSEVE